MRAFTLFSSQARTASARVVSTIARLELEKGVWPELLPWLWSMASSGTVSHREVALQTTFMLLDSIAIAPTGAGAKPTNQIPALLQLLSKTIADPESLSVRTWTVRSLGKLAEYVEPGEEQEIVSWHALQLSERSALMPTIECAGYASGHDPARCAGPPAGARGERRARSEIHLRVLRHRQPRRKSPQNLFTPSAAAAHIRKSRRKPPSSLLTSPASSSSCCALPAASLTTTTSGSCA